ncbi:unnamed protein product [Hymenolepis diminuta]|uniref:Uncharacterized protein n=1 Tax=Hymenolepis diminuta TaxID=6216 RepID=A0A564Z1Y1_HYMDI|nr:unnamed protein product [Hymenolepis diminuta]
MHFPELPFIRILHDNTSVFPPKKLERPHLCPYDAQSRSEMSKHVHQFPLFSITASFHIKGTSALMPWRGLTQVTPCYPDNYNTHWSGRTPTRPVHLLSSSARCSPSLCYSLWLL